MADLTFKTLGICAAIGGLIRFGFFVTQPLSRNTTAYILAWALYVSLIANIILLALVLWVTRNHPA